MPADKAQTSTQSAASPFAAQNWLKAQPAAAAALYSDALARTETQLRKQADFVGQLSRCKDLPELLKVQTSFVQDFWTDAAQEAQKSFTAVRKSFLPSEE